MKRMFLALVVLLLISGCAAKKDTQIANPASENCINNGGTLEIITEESGQYGMCKFKNGKQCEEWAYFRDECSP